MSAAIVVVIAVASIVVAASFARSLRGLAQARGWWGLVEVAQGRAGDGPFRLSAPSVREPRFMPSIVRAAAGSSVAWAVYMAFAITPNWVMSATAHGSFAVVGLLNLGIAVALLRAAIALKSADRASLPRLRAIALASLTHHVASTYVWIAAIGPTSPDSIVFAVLACTFGVLQASLLFAGVAGAERALARI